MRKINVFGQCSSLSANEVFDLIADFESYQIHSSVVRSVMIKERRKNYSISDWEVNFRQGILRWTEKDLFDKDNLSITFNQLSGDAAHFSGVWQLSQSEFGCLIDFQAEFDMGIPSLNEIIEPIAEKALQENIQAILFGLLKGEVQFGEVFIMKDSR